MKKNKIYLAGPLFTVAEQNFNEKLKNDLTAKGYEVFLPQEECKGKTGKDIFDTCKYGIDNSEIILAIMDGADADSGTCWEYGYAYASKKYLIAVRTDFRQSGDTKGFNAMIYYSADKLIEGETYLPKILAALEELKLPRHAKSYQPIGR